MNNQDIKDFVTKVAEYETWKDICKDRWENSDKSMSQEEFLHQEQMTIEELTDSDNLLNEIITEARNLIIKK